MMCSTGRCLALGEALNALHLLLQLRGGTALAGPQPWFRHLLPYRAIPIVIHESGTASPRQFSPSIVST